MSGLMKKKMNREIKFRAWDERNKKMMTSHLIWGENTVCLDGIMYESTSESTHLDDISVLMQYTGLKDKNGVEIYEGDILTDDISHRNINTVVRFGQHMTSDDYYASPANGWFLEGDDKDGRSLTEDMQLDYEVIGNIYENPELLDNKKDNE